MEILKTIRKKLGLSQQEMATLLHMTRDYYAMVETGRRTLPAETAQVFAALLPTFLQNQPLPTMPEKIPESHQQEAAALLHKAQLEWHKAEQDLKNCITEIGQQENLAFLLSEISNVDGLTLTNRVQNLLDSLAVTNQAPYKTNLLGKWLLLHTKRNLCAQAVEAYSHILESNQY
jgi:transcriptional regulator with XRE-family HTH domain